MEVPRSAAYGSGASCFWVCVPGSNPAIEILRSGEATNTSCQPVAFAVVSNLPITRLTRATRFRGGQARRRAGRSCENSSYLSRLYGAQAHIGRGTPEKSTSRSASFRKNGGKLINGICAGCGQGIFQRVGNGGRRGALVRLWGGKDCPRAWSRQQTSTRCSQAGCVSGPFGVRPRQR